ncbi:hypothetical protein Z043_117411 [Scleropages formosus]|uniref:CCHC-type domain-containing protein n=1 Tax=Scleropages formosus TaxID=113540 RepID=A0A0P7U9E5_SCLFO|nr:hypothetical protein Z043_117411 [Scleropages formosus]
MSVQTRGTAQFPQLEPVADFGDTAGSGADNPDKGTVVSAKVAAASEPHPTSSTATTIASAMDSRLAAKPERLLHVYHMDDTEITYLISLLTTATLQWAKGVSKKCIPITYKSFKKQFEAVFDHPVSGRTDSDRFMKIQQDNRPHLKAPEPMQIVQERLTTQERQCWLQGWLCLFCGDPGQFHAACPAPKVSNVHQPENQLSVPMVLSWGENQVAAPALMDSGVPSCFMDLAFPREQGIPTQGCDIKLRVSVLSGQPLGSGVVESQTETLGLQVRACHMEDLYSHHLGSYLAHSTWAGVLVEHQGVCCMSSPMREGLLVTLMLDHFHRQP